MSRPRAGLSAETIERFGITADELADLEEHDPNTEGDTTMPTRKPLPPNATRADRLAALPHYQRSPHAVALDTRLGRLADTALAKRGQVDDSLTDLADEFAERFAAEDARAAARDRITATAKARRAAKARG